MPGSPASIKFQPLPLEAGTDWHILATYPDGQQESIAGFKSHLEAHDWLGSKQCLEWLRVRGHEQ